MKKILLIISAMLFLCSCAKKENVSAYRQQVYKDPILQRVVSRVSDVKKYQIGYPVNEDADLTDYYKWIDDIGLTDTVLNNVGNPFNSTMKFGTHEVEKWVIDWFAPKYGFEEGEYWGLVSASGTDGNNHGIYFGRNYLEKKTGKKPVMYVSDESHYSNMRLADLQNIDLKLIKTDKMGRMLPEDFKAQMDVTRPALVVYSMGSTFKGAIDDQKAINEIIDNAKFPAVFRHVDAALFGGYLPFSDRKEMVDKRVYPFDSIAISGHKFFGVDEPCGIFLTTMEVFNNQKDFNITYLNGNMPMINCSRSATNPLKFYWLINKYGEEKYKQDVKNIKENTKYLIDELNKIGYNSFVNDDSNTVIFKRPSQEIMDKYLLAAGQDDEYGDLAHIVVMQSVTKEKIDQLIQDIKNSDKK